VEKALVILNLFTKVSCYADLFYFHDMKDRFFMAIIYLILMIGLFCMVKTCAALNGNF
jgi:hypothetical protein